jgi:hypothetical protein
MLAALPAYARSRQPGPTANFPTGVDAVRLQRPVDAMVRFGLLKKQISVFKINTVIGNG